MDPSLHGGGIKNAEASLIWCTSHWVVWSLMKCASFLILFLFPFLPPLLCLSFSLLWWRINSLSWLTLLLITLCNPNSQRRFLIKLLLSHYPYIFSDCTHFSLIVLFSSLQTSTSSSHLPLFLWPPTPVQWLFSFWKLWCFKMACL